MKDGVAKSTGNSRYLRGAGWPATYEEFRQLASAGKLPFDLAGFNPEGWAVLGDALNKANLLPDDVCALLGLPSTAVPKDGIREAYGRIGEIKASTRTTLGDHWALCNGETITSAEAPELCPMLLPSFTGAWEAKNNLLSNSFQDIRKVKFVNGFYVAVGIESQNSGAKPRLAYASLPDGPWTEVAIPASYGGCLLDITYGAGNYVACGYKKDSSGRTIPFITFAASLGGSWGVPVAASTTNEKIVAIAYGNGYFAACTSRTDSDYNRILYSQKPNGPWSAKNIGGSYEGRNALWGGLIFADGYFFASRIYGNRVYIVFSSSAVGTWTQTEMPSAGNEPMPRGVAHLNGKFIFFAYGNSYTFLYYADTPVSTWTEINIGAISVDGLTYKAGNYIACGNKIIAYSETLDSGSDWPVHEIFSGTGNADWIIGEKGRLAVFNRSNGFGVSMVKDGYALPTISVADAYAYIRTK